MTANTKRQTILEYFVYTKEHILYFLTVAEKFTNVLK